jgi:hypothetical protein
MTEERRTSEATELEELLFTVLTQGAPSCAYFEKHLDIAEKLVKQPLTLKQEIYRFTGLGNDPFVTAYIRAEKELETAKRKEKERGYQNP